MITEHITMEFILTWAAADAVNSWLHKNDMSKFSMSAHQGISLFFEMEKSIQECIDRHNIQLQGECDVLKQFALIVPATYMFANRSCTKTQKWIKAVGPEVNRYCHFLNRVCDIRDEICVGVKELYEEKGFSIEGELIHNKQTNYWLKRAQNMGRFRSQPPATED